jgi:beta-galactosidase
VTGADKSGLLVPRSKNHIQFEIEGAGEIIAVDNGDATSLDPFQAKEHNVFNGLALVIVRSTKEAGKITLTAKSDGLAPATVTIRSN